MLTHQYYEVFLSSVSRFPPPTQWSQCSRDELDFGLDNGLGSCLDNNPTTVSVILLIMYVHTYIYTQVHVCMYCIYTCMHTNMEIHIHVHIYYIQSYMYIYMHACIQTWEYTYIHIYTHTYIHVHIYSHTCTYICMHAYKHVNTCTYIYTHIHTYIHIIQSYIVVYIYAMRSVDMYNVHSKIIVSQLQAFHICNLQIYILNLFRQSEKPSVVMVSRNLMKCVTVEVQRLVQRRVRESFWKQERK